MSDSLLTSTSASSAVRGDLIVISGGRGQRNGTYRVTKMVNATTLRVRPATRFWRAVAWVRWKVRRAKDQFLGWWWRYE